MSLQTKALYNLLKFNDSSINCDKWQVEDLRKEDTEALFLRLKNFGISIDKRHFTLYAENCDSPEELTECLVVEELPQDKYDPIYLIIFELWRRLFPEKPSMSIFCDELDLRIYLYLNKKLTTDELIQDAVDNLLDILNDNVDSGKDYEKVFESVSKYCAYDLDIFLYDYIADQIDDEHDTYANDLIEGFYHFIKNMIWFDFLRARLLSKTDITITNEILKNIIDSLIENFDIDLSLEILNFMTQVGDPDLFVMLAKISVKNLKNEEDFLELMEISTDFYRRLDNEEKATEVLSLIKNRFKVGNLKEIEEKDDDIDKFFLLLNKS
jgi:hypothetical protein